jgi:hypothetical protein
MESVVHIDEPTGDSLTYVDFDTVGFGASYTNTSFDNTATIDSVTAKMGHFPTRPFVMVSQYDGSLIGLPSCLGRDGSSFIISCVKGREKALPRRRDGQ